MRNTGALKEVYESPTRKQPSPNPKVQAIKRRLMENAPDKKDMTNGQA